MFYCKMLWQVYDLFILKMIFLYIMITYNNLGYNLK
jgi:hypothetical protein